MFCHENDTYRYFHMNQQKMRQLTPTDVNGDADSSENIYTYRNYVYKIKLETTIGYPRVRIRNTSDHKMQLLGSEIYILNFLKNHIKIESICQWLDYEVSHKFVSYHTQNVYKEIWADNLVDNSFTSSSYTHALIIIPTLASISTTMSYDSSELVVLVVEINFTEHSLRMHALILWMIIIILAGIIIFLVRQATETSVISYPEATLRSLSAVVGTGNVGWSNRAHRSEKIFLFSLIIFGLFFNTYYTDELFAVKMVGSNNEKYKRINDLLDAEVTVFYEPNLVVVISALMDYVVTGSSVTYTSLFSRCAHKMKN